jgi:hypothetical protein
MTDFSPDLFILSIGSAVLLVAVVCVVLAHYWNERTEALRAVRAQFNGVSFIKVAPRAYFRGFDRSWDGQWKGGGVLVLTHEVVYFRPWSRHVDITVPVGRIEKVTGDGELGKKGLWHDQLRISYVGMDDQARVAIWSVKDAHGWISDVLEARERKILPCLREPSETFISK